MTTFDDRKKGQEAKYSKDQETIFRVTARRNKLLGLWAAEHLGIHGEAADAYARQVIEADFEKPGDDDVVEKIMGDFSAQSVDIEENELRQKMDDFLGQAREQIEAGT